MTAFTGSVPGTPESRWAASQRLIALAQLPVRGRDRRIVVLAVPDEAVVPATMLAHFPAEIS